MMLGAAFAAFCVVPESKNLRKLGIREAWDREEES